MIFLFCWHERILGYAIATINNKTTKLKMLNFKTPDFIYVLDMSISLPGGVICRFLDSKSCPGDYLAGGEVLDFYRGPNDPDEVHRVTELLVPLNLSRFSMRNRLTVLVISIIGGAFQAALEMGPLRGGGERVQGQGRSFGVCEGGVRN
jgi:hypothetical protein